MSRTKTRRFVGVIAATAGLAAGLVGAQTTAQADFEDATMLLPRDTSPYSGVGPHRPYVQQIMIGGVVPLKYEALINRTEHGFLYRAGQQNSDLTVTYANGRLRFVDKGTASLKWMPRACKPIAVSQGIGASCAVASKFTASAPMLVEVWPRLGDDVVDSTALPALFDMSVLGDRGNDVARFGDGDDFFNGAQDVDRVSGGGGRDWIRGGTENDTIDGGADADYLVGVDGHDTIRGGSGNDRLYGIAGNDTLFADAGDDYLNCGTGTDEATLKGTDKEVDCERTNSN